MLWLVLGVFLGGFLGSLFVCPPPSDPFLFLWFDVDSFVHGPGDFPPFSSPRPHFTVETKEHPSLGNASFGFSLIRLDLAL